MDHEESALFWDHVSELRKTLIHIFVWILIGSCLCFIFYQPIIAILTYPLHKKTVRSPQVYEVKQERLFNHESHAIIYHSSRTPSYVSKGSHLLENGSYFIPPGGYLDVEKTVPSQNLIVLGPLEGISTVFKVCFWLGLVITSPAWGFALLRFISPALKGNERGLILPFISLSYFFIITGILFAYFLTIPAANLYLSAFNSGIGTNLWTLSHYLDYTFFLVMANGVAFEMGLILLFLVHLRVLSMEIMVNYRKYMIVLSFIVGALLTPPEILTQLMLAIPLMILYELAIFYARFRRSKKQPT